MTLILSDLKRRGTSLHDVLGGSAQMKDVYDPAMAFAAAPPVEELAWALRQL